jgi:RES domain-containing protein
MIVFRLSKAKFSADLSGKGAEKSGGRWNSKGTALIYTSESRALCTAGIAVHIPLGILPMHYQLVSIEIPDGIRIKELTANDLPENWKSFPHQHTTQELGDQFVNEGEFPVLKVPSAVVQDEYNFLINAVHSESKRIQIKSIEPFTFDNRLFVK